MASSPTEKPTYPVYQSPDGKSEQIAPNAATEVRLKHAGWRLVRTPRQSNRTGQAGQAGQAKKKSTTDK